MRKTCIALTMALALSWYALPAMGATVEDMPVLEQSDMPKKDAAAALEVEADPTPAAFVPAERLSVSLSGTDILFPGQSVQATAEVFPQSAMQSVVWSSSSNALLKVDNRGLAMAASNVDLPAAGVYVDL